MAFNVNVNMKSILKVANVSSVVVVVSYLPPPPMSVLMLFSEKGGDVRGCLNGSLWLKSVVLVSPSSVVPMSPGSAGRFRVLPAPGARSKFSFMTARLSASTLKAA